MKNFDQIAYRIRRDCSEFEKTRTSDFDILHYVNKCIDDINSIVKEYGDGSIFSKEVILNCTKDGATLPDDCYAWNKIFSVQYSIDGVYWENLNRITFQEREYVSGYLIDGRNIKVPTTVDFINYKLRLNYVALIQPLSMKIGTLTGIVSKTASFTPIISSDSEFGYDFTKAIDSYGTIVDKFGAIKFSGLISSVSGSINVLFEDTPTGVAGDILCIGDGSSFVPLMPDAMIDFIIEGASRIIMARRDDTNFKIQSVFSEDEKQKIILLLSANENFKRITITNKTYLI